MCKVNKTEPLPVEAANFPLQLAPMVGLSHAVLRQVVAEYMPAGISTDWPTEMLNSNRIPDERIGRNSETLVLEHESNIIPQILGNEARPIQSSIDKLADLWNLKGIDINMGCPVQKALRHNYGVALMGDFKYACDVVRFAKVATDRNQLLLSVKLRAVDSQATQLETVDFVQGLIDAGADRIVLHPRTAAQQRRGQADWDQIRILVDRFQHQKIQIVGNGDIQTADDVIQMIKDTGTQLVMAGRALTVRPWLMWQVGERLGLSTPAKFHGKMAPLTEYEEGAEYGRMLLRFVELVEEVFCQSIQMDQRLAIRKIQFFVRTNHVWLEFGHTLMSKLSSAKDFNDLKARIESFFANPQRLFQRTALRQ